MFAIACLVVNCAMYRPLVRKLDSNIKRSRRQLMMFPAEVINGVPAIKQLLKAHLSSFTA